MKPALLPLAALAVPLLLAGTYFFAPGVSGISVGQPVTTTPGPKVALQPKLPASAAILSPGSVKVVDFWSLSNNLPLKAFTQNKDILWALPSKYRLNTKRYGVTLNTDSQNPRDDVKVVFHSRFDDGTPCGTWSAAQYEQETNSYTSLRPLAKFSPPNRTGWGWMWVELWNKRGEKIGRSKDCLFLVLPIAIESRENEWHPTEKENEWKREIVLYAGGRIPREWYKQSVFRQQVPAWETGFFTLPGIPIRSKIVPSPFIEKSALPHSSISPTSGRTQIPTGTQYDPNEHKSSPSAASLVVTQTIKWKLGDSNQLSSAQVFAEIALPTSQAPKGIS